MTQLKIGDTISPGADVPRGAVIRVLRLLGSNPLTDLVQIDGAKARHTHLDTEVLERGDRLQKFHDFDPRKVWPGSEIVAIAPLDYDCLTYARAVAQTYEPVRRELERLGLAERPKAEVKADRVWKVGDLVGLEDEAKTLPANCVVRFGFFGSLYFAHVTNATRGRARLVMLARDRLQYQVDPESPQDLVGATVVALDVPPPPSGPRRSYVRTLAAAGVEEAKRILVPQVGEEATVEDWPDLPPGTVLEGTESCGNVRIGKQWYNVCLEAPFLREGREIDCDFRNPRHGRVLSLTAPQTRDRIELARHLAEGSVTEHASWMRAQLQEAGLTRRALQPGDLVDGRWSELPPGAIVDTKQGVQPIAARGRGGHWSWCVVTAKSSVGDWDGRWLPFREWTGAVYLGQVEVGLEGEPLTRAFAALGYGPAARLVAELDAVKVSESEPRRLRDVGPRTLVQVATSEGPPLWVYVLPDRSHWIVKDEDQRRQTLTQNKGCRFSDEFRALRVLREIQDVIPVHLQPGVWERLIAESSVEIDHLGRLTEVSPSPTPPALQVGSTVTVGDLASLPVGAVIHFPDGSQTNYAVKTSDGWYWTEANGARRYGRSWTTTEVADWISADHRKHIVATLAALNCPQGEHDAGIFIRALASAPPTGLEVPTADQVQQVLDRVDPSLDALASALGVPSRYLIGDQPSGLDQLVDRDVTLTLRGQKVVNINLTPDPDSMHNQPQIEIPGDTVMPEVKPAKSTDNAVQPTPETGPGFLARLGTAFKAAGSTVARKATAEVTAGLPLKGIDAARLIAHRGVLEGVERGLGETKAIAALRVMNSPLTHLAEDLVVGIGCHVAGKAALGDVLLERVATRVVQGGLDLGLDGVVKVANAVWEALGAAESSIQVTASQEPAGQVESEK